MGREDEDTGLEDGGDWVSRVFTAGTPTIEMSDADVGVLLPQTPGPTHAWSHLSWTSSNNTEVRNKFTISDG